MGYYKDRIKGSKLRPYLHKLSFISTVVTFVASGIILYGSPGLQRIGKLMEQGYFDDSPERRKIREKWNFQFEYGTNLRTPEIREKTNNIFDDVEFRDL